MKEIPMIFNTGMVQAIQDGRKTVTRRPMKPQPVIHPVPPCNPNYNVVWNGVYMWKEWEQPHFTMTERCPYGNPGDRIYVRETWNRLMMYDENDMPYSPHRYEMFYKADGIPDIRLLDEDGYEEDNQCFRWKPSIHMPKRYARIWLEITDVRVERVQDITEEQAEAEGLQMIEWSTGIDYRQLYGVDPDSGEDQLCSTESFYDSFRQIWDSIYQNWNSNPWVWVIEFKRVER